jgi:hypothetical protein
LRKLMIPTIAILLAATSFLGMPAEADVVPTPGHVYVSNERFAEGEGCAGSTFMIYGLRTVNYPARVIAEPTSGCAINILIQRALTTNSIPVGEIFVEAKTFDNSVEGDFAVAACPVGLAGNSGPMVGPGDYTIVYIPVAYEQGACEARYHNAWIWPGRQSIVISAAVLAAGNPRCHFSGPDIWVNEDSEFCEWSRNGWLDVGPWEVPVMLGTVAAGQAASFPAPAGI